MAHKVVLRSRSPWTPLLRCQNDRVYWSFNAPLCHAARCYRWRKPLSLSTSNSGIIGAVFSLMTRSSSESNIGEGFSRRSLYRTLFATLSGLGRFGSQSMSKGRRLWISEGLRSKNHILTSYGRVPNCTLGLDRRIREVEGRVEICPT